MRIAVLPWGDPSAWRYANYCYEFFCKEGFSTLEFLVYSKELFPDLALVLVLDTLATRLPTQSYRSYSELVERVREYAGRYICGRDRVQTNVEVLPGVMGCGGKGQVEFKADLATTRLLTLYNVYFRILDLAKCDHSGGEIKILLDTTHGINYFSILVRESVLEAAAMVAVALGASVKVSVFNADPLPHGVNAPARSNEDPCVPFGGGPLPRLKYNQLGEYRVYPWDLMRYFRYSSGSVDKLVSDPQGCHLDEDKLKRLLRVSKLAIASFRVGALVELAELVKGEPDFIKSASEMLERARKCWLLKSELKQGDSCWYTSFTKLQDGLRLLLHAHAVFSGVGRVLATASEVEGVSLKKVLRELMKLLKGSEVTIALVDYELSKVEATLSRKEKGGVTPLLHEWIPYSQLMREEATPEFECDRPGAYDLKKLERNFVAHAGFLKDALELKKLGDEDVAYRVRPGCQKVVESALKRVFERLCSSSDKSSSRDEKKLCGSVGPADGV
ncbi:MAG: TM1812 family CRISPR-associated protein [Zestosphaera sp.]